jgi:hypothetical protein
MGLLILPAQRWIIIHMRFVIDIVITAGIQDMWMRMGDAWST